MDGWMLLIGWQHTSTFRSHKRSEVKSGYREGLVRFNTSRNTERYRVIPLLSSSF